MPLVHCIYASSAVHELNNVELAKLVVAARAKNKSLGITGILVYMSGRFFQILEGESATVRSLYDTIVKDPRHAHVTQIVFESIARRSFEGWSMGIADFSGNKLKQIQALTDPASGTSALAHLREGRDKKLLLAFCEGRWGRTETSSVAFL